MARSVTVVGEDRAARSLTNMGRRALDQAHTFAVEGQRAQRQITGVPVRSGRLERGVRGGSEAILNVGPQGYTIATRVPYARFVFGGTKHMRARPPKVPRGLGASAATAAGRDITHDSG